MLTFTLAGCKGKDKATESSEVSVTPAVTEVPSPTTVVEDKTNNADGIKGQAWK